jgi:hemoglobin
MDSDRIYGNLGTLYAKCGGIFGVAAFVDRCMDKWMADDTLNANVKVRTWHEKAQRPGFKFLVVQVVSNLTGGPQEYTGRPMDTAHKHLGITESEWGVFMELFNEVCSEFSLPADVQDDLNALLISMEEDCVSYPGERQWRDPGPMRPPGSSLYARVGGVYPIALFVDRLVDSLLSDDRVEIPVDGQKRNEASLKYLLTEVMCNLCGGPEVITSRSEECLLLIPKSQWQVLTATAAIAVDHFPVAQRSALLQVVERNRAAFVDPNSSDDEVVRPQGAGARVKTLEEAAAGKMLSKATIAARHADPGAHVGARRRVFGDPRTIYGKTGGVFGLAKFADKLMDTWMENPLLNANGMVARWHESQQKFGFKFLVTQLMGYLTGGPQRYTGRPIDEAHQHLNITEAQWVSFIADADKVFTEFNVEGAVRAELMNILARFQDQCVCKRETPDPGRPNPHPASVGTLYHKLGGVYPIAQYADRLVELVLSGTSGVVVDQTGSHRHAPGLKYGVTELLCNGTGGPEVATCKGFDAGKLGVPANQWPQFIAIATEAAALFPTQHHRTALVAAINALQKEFCVGMEEDAAETGVGALTKLGFGLVEAAAALDKCGGDSEKAADLLLSGWTPRMEAEVEAVAEAPAAASACPFASAMSLSSGAGACPFASSVATATPTDAVKARNLDFGEAPGGAWGAEGRDCTHARFG